MQVGSIPTPEELDDLITEILITAKKNGIYRRHISDNFSQFTEQEISKAVKECRKRGMYSVADMRHLVLGTYYQFDGEVKDEPT